MFIAINILVSLFFVFLIYLGIKFRVYSFIPVNFLGIIVTVFAVIYELRQRQDPLVTLFMLILLLVVFASDFFISLSRITEKKFLSHPHQAENPYLKVDATIHGLKFIGSVAFIQYEIQQKIGIRHSWKIQALDDWCQGNYRLANGDFQAAILKFQASLARVPSFSATLNLVGAYLLTNQTELALATCEKILAEEYDPGAARINQSLALARLRQFDEAFESLELALHAGATSAEICLLKGNLLIQQGKIDAALEVLQEALLHNPDTPHAWYQKGRCLIKIGKQQEAQDCFARVLRLEPRHHQAWYCQGNLLNRQEQYKPAIEHYEAALKINPEFNEAWNNKGIALCRLGQFREGLNCYENALKIKPNYLEAWINQGLAYEDSGDFDQAIVSYQKFLELAPQSMPDRIRSIQRRVVEVRELLKHNSVRHTKHNVPEHSDGTWQESHSISTEKEFASESDCV